MLLAWKKAQRFEASTFLPRASVWAPLPRVSENARNSAITAISNAIFLLEPEACSACSACSMLSCAPMIPLPAKLREHWPIGLLCARELCRHTTVIPGRATSARTRNPDKGSNFWIPGSLATRVPRNDDRDSGAGMRHLIHLEQPLAVDAGVDLRGRKRGVAEQFLDRAQVAAAGEQVGRERVPQRMRCGAV